MPTLTSSMRGIIFAVMVAAVAAVALALLVRSQAQATPQRVGAYRRPRADGAAP